MSDVVSQYRGCVEQYLATLNGEDPAYAYDLGRRAMAEGVSLLDILDAHHEVVGPLYLENPRLASRLHPVLMESMAPFELAQRAYRESLDTARQQLQHIFNTLDVVFFSISHPDIRTLLFSPSCLQIYGLPAQDFYDDPWLWRSLLPPDDMQRLDQTWPLLSDGKPVTFEHRIRRRDGTTRWLEAHVQPALDSAGALTRVDGIVFDITDRMRRKQRSDARYAVTGVLVDAASIEEAGERIIQALCETIGREAGGLWLVDARAGVLRCVETWHAPSVPVRQFETLSRATTLARGAGLPGRVWLSEKPAWIPDLAADPDFSRASAAYQEGLRNGIAFPLVGTELHGVIELFSLEPLAEDSELLETLADLGCQIGQFIERRRTEAALRQSEEQLRQSQKMEVVGQLAGGVAHDFNNLLCAIIGYSDMALRELKPHDPMREDILEIKQAGQRAAALTRQLLAFSRRQTLQPRILDLNAIVADMERMLQRIIGEDIDLKTELGTDVGRVKADPNQVEQVVLNLAVNAREAMAEGGRLTVQTTNAELDEEYAHRYGEVTAGLYVMLTMTDTGIGMDAATRSRIFEPFFTTKTTGTGLGLATVFGIVKQSKGHISVYSEIGRGTTFRVYLPRAEGAQEAEPTTGSHAPARGSETILLVEDEETVRTLTVRVLRTQGYKVREAANSKQALAILDDATDPIDLLITDIVMPEMGGVDLVGKVSPKYPRMRVLYMSGYARGALSHRGELEANVAFLEKPFSSNALLQKVREVLS